MWNKDYDIYYVARYIVHELKLVQKPFPADTTDLVRLYSSLEYYEQVNIGVFTLFCMFFHVCIFVKRKRVLPAQM